MWSAMSALEVDTFHESVDTFIPASFASPFAPNHIRVISPEKVGLCLAYSWLGHQGPLMRLPPAAE